MGRCRTFRDSILLLLAFDWRVAQLGNACVLLLFPYYPGFGRIICSSVAAGKACDGEFRSRQSSIALAVRNGTCLRKAFSRAKLNGAGSCKAKSLGFPAFISSNEKRTSLPSSRCRNNR